MIIYVILWAYIVLLALVIKKSNLNPKYFIWFAFMGMTFVLGLRGTDVGEDTWMYLTIPNVASQKTWKDIVLSFPRIEWNYISYGSCGGYSEQIETLYMAYNKIIMSIFQNPQMVLLITAALTNALMFRFIYFNIDKKDDIYIAIYIYMCDNLFMSSFNLMRQIFAMSIAVQAMYEIKRKKNFQTVLWLTIAAFIHFSAVVFLLAIVIYRLKNKKKYYKWLVVGVCMLPFVLSIISPLAAMLSPKYAVYLKKSFWNPHVNGTIILWVLIIVGIIILLNVKGKDDKVWWLIYILTIYIGIEMLGLRFTVISRVAIYFRIGLVIFLPTLKKYISKKDRLLYNGVILIMMTISYFSYASSPARLYTFGF